MSVSGLASSTTTTSKASLCALPSTLSIQQAMRGGDRRAVREAPESPRPFAYGIAFRDGDLTLVPGDQALHRWTCRGVFDCHDAVGAAVESREMIEGERLAVDQDPRLEASRHAARGEVPRRDVVPRRLDDRYAVEKHRREIDPLLVGAQDVFHFRPAQAIDAVRPPVDEPPPLICIAHTDEPKV